MRSLILFLAVAQLTAAVLYFFIEFRSADDPAAMVGAFETPVQLLAAALALSFAAIYLSRWGWSRAIALLIALVLPFLFLARDMGLSLG